MSRAPGPTRFIRVRLDFMVQLDAPVSSIPFGGREDVNAVVGAAIDAVRKLPVVPSSVVVAGLVTGHMQTSLDYRVEKAAKRAAKESKVSS